jgi:hypothetical protein
MAITYMSAGHQDPVSSFFKGLEDEVGIDLSGAHNPDDTYFRRVLHAAHSGQVGS